MTGHGRVWGHVLACLTDRVSLVPVEMRPFSAAAPVRVTADVWLADGHDGSLCVEEPVVAAVHEVGWTTRELRSYLDPLFCGTIAAGTASGVRGAADVLTPSDWSRRQVLNTYGVRGDRIHTVAYGVDLGVFRPGLPAGRQRVSAATGTDDPPYILFISSLLPRKNLASVRQAVARLARRGFDHVLVVVAGDAPDRGDSNELRQLAEAELPGAPGRIVSIRGLEDHDVAALMAGADAVCLPSLSEGFGLTALEAMACGAPVIVSDRGALPEVVGDGGLIVAPTPDAVEDGLLRILRDSALAAALRGAARARAEKFPWERTAAGWLGVLERAAAEASGPPPGPAVPLPGGMDPPT